MNTKFLLFIIIFSLLTSCAHYQNVIKSDDGHHVVKLTANDTGDGIKEAINQGQDFCKNEKGIAVFGAQNSQYKGKDDEKDYLKKKKLLDDGIDCGGGANIVSALCSVIGLVLVSQKLTMEKNYQIEVNFTCEKISSL